MSKKNKNQRGDSKKRSQRAAIAQETLTILNDGHYTPENGDTIDLSDALERMTAGTQLFTPDALETLHAQALSAAQKTTNPTPVSISVTAETTLDAARRLVDERNIERVLCLNFASAKNPGGGFLGGSQAQEESLARASCLYHSLIQAPGYYKANRHTRSAFYTDHMIYSPDVPVLRDEAGAFLPSPCPVSFVTAPAVNAGIVRQREGRHSRDIPEVMRRRINYVLAIAAENKHRTLVLGAWGCGVFRNDPAELARLFAEALAPTEPLAWMFDEVVFAIYDNSRAQNIFNAFQSRLGS